MRRIHSLICFAIVFCPVLAGAASTDQQVTFNGDDEATLAGTLELPAGKFCGAAVVLIAGSGPTDRDGNQPPSLKTDLLKQIAQGLADRGIASLRYDKRGMYANRAELPADKSKYGDFFSWEHFVGDAAGAYRFLRQQPNVDPNRVAILGHSEGGLLALDSARLLKSEGHPPAALILISTPGRTIDAVIEDQLKRLLKTQKATEAQRDYFLKENARINDAIRNTGQVPADVPPGLAALYPAYLGKFYHSELAVDPSKLAGDFSGPVLVIAGGADVQVSPDLDAKALDHALAARRHDVHTLAIIANASHNMKIVEKADDSGFAGPLAAEAMDQLQKWAVENLATVHSSGN